LTSVKAISIGGSVAISNSSYVTNGSSTSNKALPGVICWIIATNALTGSTGDIIYQSGNRSITATTGATLDRLPAHEKQQGGKEERE
jgi:hypothetical protein